MRGGNRGHPTRHPRGDAQVRASDSRGGVLQLAAGGYGAAYEFSGGEMNALEKQIWLAVKAADTRFQETGAGGTKTWLRDYLLPALEAQRLYIVPQSDLDSLRAENAKLRKRNELLEAKAYGDDR